MNELEKGNVSKNNSLVKLHFELCQFLFTSRVQSNLGGCVAASLLKFLVELVELPAQSTSSLVCPCPGLSLSLKIFIQLL